MLRPPNASRVKALHATARSAQEARPGEEQVDEPTPTAESTPTPSAPRVIAVEKNAASPKAMAQLKAEGILPEQVELTSWSNTSITLSNKIIARIKQRVKAGLGFFSFETAWHTGHRSEVMHMVRKGQMRGVEKGDLLEQVAFIARLFGVAA